MTRRLTIPSTIRPIKLGHYELTATGLQIQGKPSFDEHVGVGEFIKRAHRASGFWLADWLRYGEERTDWAERLSQAVDATGLTEKTLKNVRAVGAIDPSRRRDGVDFSLHAEVAGMSPEEQEDWLEQAEEHGWNRRELRMNIRATNRPKVLEGQAALQGMFRVIYADPPWQTRDSRPTEDGSLGESERHRAALSVQELCKLPVAAHAMSDAVLFLWVTSPMLLTNPGPREVIEAWEFTYKTGIVWDNVLGNFGHYVRVHHEHLLICTRGSCLPDAPTPQPDSVQTIRRAHDHSAKPAEFRKLITKLYTKGRKLELFARTKTPGWTCFGSDARRWAQDAEKTA